MKILNENVAYIVNLTNKTTINKKSLHFEDLFRGKIVIPEKSKCTKPTLCISVDYNGVEVKSLSQTFYYLIKMLITFSRFLAGSVQCRTQVGQQVGLVTN